MESNNMMERVGQWPAQTKSYIEDLQQEKVLLRTYCESHEQISELLRSRAVDIDRGHEISSEYDLIKLLGADLGIAVLPESS